MNIKKRLTLKRLLRLEKQTRFMSLSEARQCFQLGCKHKLEFDSRFIKPVKIPIVH